MKLNLPLIFTLLSLSYPLNAQNINLNISQNNDISTAEKLFTEGMKLYEQNTKESKLQAIEKIEQSLKICQKVCDKSQQSLIINNIAFIYDSLREKSKALDYYNQSLVLKREIGDKKGEELTLNNIGKIYSSLGNKQKALDYYHQSLSIIVVLGDKKREAQMLSNIGAVNSDLGNKNKALEYYNQALKLREKFEDKEGQAFTLNNIGAVYNDLGEKQKALDYYLKSLPLFRELKYEELEAIILSNIASTYSDLGEKQKALDYYLPSVELSKKVGDKQAIAITLTNLGTVYYDLGEDEKALNYYLESLPIIRSVGDEFAAGINLSNIGNIYENLKQYNKALEYYNQSLMLTRKVGDKKGQGRTLSNIGNVYKVLADNDKAIAYYHQALALNRQVGDKLQESKTLSNIGDNYSKLKQEQKAIEYYNQSLIISKNVGDKQQEAIALKSLALSQLNQGNLAESLAQINAAIEIIENLRTKINDADLRASYLATVQDYYKLKIEILMRLNKQDSSQGYEQEALNTNERAKARSLVELLTESRADIRQGIAPELLTKEKTLLQQINNKENERIKLVRGKYTESQLQKVKQELESLLTQYQQLKSEIKAKNPKYSALTQPQPLTVKEIQQQVLDKDTVLLEYSLGIEKSYVWLVSQDKISSYELPSEKEIEGKVKEFRREITDGSTSIKNLQTKSLPLSKIILAPVMNEIGNKRLLIVGDGSLQYIPFNALQNPNEMTKYSPLILSNEIITLPSASTVISLRKNQLARGKNAKQIAVIADPVFNENDDRLKRPKTPNKKINDPSQKLALNRAVGNTLIQLERLKATRQEAEQIKKLIPEKEQIQILDFDANLENVKSYNLENYKIIHFATHGLLNSENPELSGLVLSLFDNQGNPQDGFFRLNDIFNLKLNADLVVLSACQTGLGKQVKGEGLIGLTRGFMYAGTPRVIVSLWSVDDQGTSVLMSRFYELMLKEKLPVSSALRQAQIEMLKQDNYKLPYYWAAFTLQGEWK